jgi:hypothetical protein
MTTGYLSARGGRQDSGQHGIKAKPAAIPLISRQAKNYFALMQQ